MNSDGDGLWSDPPATTTPLNTTANTPPYFIEGDNGEDTASGDTTARAVAERTPAGRAVGAPVAAADPDGDTLTYSLGGPDAARFAIASSTGQINTKAALDHEVRPSYTVTVAVTDGNIRAATPGTVTQPPRRRTPLPYSPPSAQLPATPPQPTTAPPATPPAFTDVHPDSVHAPGIAAITAAGITIGCHNTDSRYCPDQPVTRAQMATFLTRALKLPTPPTPTNPDHTPTPTTLHTLRAQVRLACYEGDTTAAPTG